MYYILVPEPHIGTLHIPGNIGLDSGCVERFTEGKENDGVTKEINLVASLYYLLI